MNTLEITQITRGSWQSTVTFCEVAPDGSRDGFETVIVPHDEHSAAPTDDADIDAAMATMASHRGAEY